MELRTQDIVRQHKDALKDPDKRVRDREFAKSIGLSEGELICAYACEGEAQRLHVDLDVFLEHAPFLGPVLALTRNDTVVHEMRAPFTKVFPGKGVSLTMGEIDLRIFHEHWHFAFAKDVKIADQKMMSLQFFDATGTAVFKLYEQEGSDRAAWLALIERLNFGSSNEMINVIPPMVNALSENHMPDIEEFRRRWGAMNDVHQLHDILQDMEIGRHDAVKLIGQDFAHELDKAAIEKMLFQAGTANIPIMCFVQNPGCIQIYTGMVGPVKIFGPWLNILDEKFHMHLNMQLVDKVWSVRKPTKDGIVSSVEVFDAEGNLVVQFFGERKEGYKERDAWRNLVANLPGITEIAVA